MSGNAHHHSNKAPSTNLVRHYGSTLAVHVSDRQQAAGCRQAGRQQEAGSRQQAAAAGRQQEARSQADARQQAAGRRQAADSCRERIPRQLPVLN